MAHKAILPKNPTSMIKHRAGLYQVETKKYGTVFLENHGDCWAATNETGKWIASELTKAELERVIFSI